MKRLWLLCMVVVGLAVPGLAAADNEMLWEKKLPFKTATIHYAIKGMEEGKETLYIRDHGRERATYRETVSNVMGMKMTNRTITLKTPDTIYSYDLEKHQGYKGVNPQRYMIEEYNRLPAAEQQKVQENAKKMGAAYTEGMGGSIQQNAMEILGFSCDKVEIMGGSASYLIHDTDITLKTEMNMMGMNLTMVAEAVDKDRADDKFFQHPSGITAEVNSQSDEMAKNMASQAIAILKDPDHAKKEGKMPMMGVPGEGGQVSPEEREEMLQQMEQMLKGRKGKGGQ